MKKRLPRDQTSQSGPDSKGSATLKATKPKVFLKPERLYEHEVPPEPDHPIASANLIWEEMESLQTRRYMLPRISNVTQTYVRYERRDWWLHDEHLEEFLKFVNASSGLRPRIPRNRKPASWKESNTAEPACSC